MYRIHKLDGESNRKVITNLGSKATIKEFDASKHKYLVEFDDGSRAWLKASQFKDNEEES